MQKVLAFILVLALTAGISVFAQTRSAAVLFQEALTLEEVKGDLEKAIATYTMILEHAGADRNLTARALLHLAGCYERLGRPEAAATYDRVIRDYSDQPAFAAEARTRRARLGDRASSRSEAGLVERQQVWAGDDVNLQGRPSADGRYLAYIDASAGRSNVAVRDLRNGTNRRLTNAPPGFHADLPAVAPDNSMVAYGWSTSDETWIRVINIDGTGMRELPVPPTPGIDDLVWSPDAKRLAAVLPNEDRTRQIVLIDVAEGTWTQLRSMGSRNPWLGGFSPDGRFLVYSAIPTTAAPEETDSDVFVIAADGQHETAAVSGPTRDKNPVWTPDGNALVWVRDRSGSNSLWAIRVSDGQPVGSPREIRSDFGPSVNLGFSRDGTLLYGLEGTERDVFIATIDPETLNVTGSPKKLSEHFVGSNSTPHWSPDGRFVAFLRGPDARTQTVVIRSMADDVERALPTRLLDARFVMSFGLSWFPDSRSLLIRDAHPAQERKTIVRRIDVESGKDVVLFEAGEWDVWPPLKLSPDGASVYYTAFARDATRKVNQLRLMRRELATGREVELLQRETGFYSFYGLMVSPDASRLVFLDNVENRPRTLLTLPVAGGQPTELYPTGTSVPRPTSSVGTWLRAWTSDGRYVISSTGGGEVWAFPTGPGTPRKLDWKLPAVGDLAPDGRHTVYPAIKQTRELRTIQNLLSRIPATR